MGLGSAAKINKRTCLGTNLGMSSRKLNRLRTRFTNCTTVEGNLEITGLWSATADLSFLEVCACYLRFKDTYIDCDIVLNQNAMYSQTSVYEHNSFWKAVRKPSCSKTESYFPTINNVKKINSFHAPKE